MNCPHCGRSVQLIKDDTAFGPVYSRPWTQYAPMADSARRFGEVAQTPAAELPDLQTRDTPLRGYQNEDFWIPFKRAMGAMFFWAVSVAGPVGCWATPDNRFRDDLIWFVVSTGIVGGLTYFAFTLRADTTLTMHERAENKQKDPSRQPDHVQFTLKREDKDIEGDSWELFNLPCPNGQFFYLQDFCQAILDGDATFSERGSRKGSKDPKKGATHFGYSPGLWEDLRDEFEQRGWAYWQSEGRQGMAFTAVGKRMVRLIAEGE